jgi:Mg2+/Co2+ transporter CorB
MAIGYKIGLCILLLACGGYFSGSETGVYRVSRFRVRIGTRNRRPFYSLLADLLHDGHGVILSTLIGTNLFCYLATSMVTYILLDLVANKHAAEAYATLIMTPALFIYVDIIPKSIFYYRSDTLMPLLAPLLWSFHVLLTWSGIIATLKWIARWLNRLFGSSADTPTAISITGRHEIRQIIHETREEGILTTTQRDILHRMIDSQDIRLGQIVIPLDRVETLNVASDRDTVMNTLRRVPYTRIPVYEKSPDNILGYVRPAEILCDRQDFTDIRPFLHTIGRIPNNVSTLEAIDQMAKQSYRIAIVWDERKRSRPDFRAMGIVTLKDLVEELTGDPARSQ